jgi:glycine/D-amino acid oxidase-like deaminating enzyme
MMLVHAAPCMMTCAKLQYLQNPAVSFCDYGRLEWSFLACLQEVAQALSSHLDSAEVVQQQACIRPLSPDGSPIIGQHPYVAGAYIATGVKNTN